MLLTFIFDWITDYMNTPEIQLTLSQRILFTLALVIIGLGITAICAVITEIAIKIKDRK